MRLSGDIPLIRAAGLAWVCLALAGATGTPDVVVPPGPCSSPYGAYLLAPNSGALVRVDRPDQTDGEVQVIVFRPQRLRGWASQRLLSRFDLEVEAGGVRVINTGGFCSERTK